MNNETIGGVKTFTSSPVLPAPTAANHGANKSYVDTAATDGKSCANLILRSSDTGDDVAAAHNCIYRGKNLTNVYTLAELSAKLAAGDFSDLYIGDYFTRKFTHGGSTVDVNFRIAHFNYWKYMGAVDATNGLAIDGSNPNTIGQTTANHLILMPDTSLFSAQMNPTNDTTGALRGCALWATLQNTVYGELNAANCMDGHIVGHSDWLTTGVNATADSMAGSALVGSSNASAWADELIGLCSEPMVYGGTVWSSSARDVGCKKAQLALFRLDPTWINGRAARYAWWLGAVASSTAFAYADSRGGGAYYASASHSRGVRPFFLFA
ncbi:MAG: hypothetical protein E7022_03255 [Desulfovibrio desulfuricans]|nr:hypothetical protein [Desulfovibrio desulfuricans]